MKRPSPQFELAILAALVASAAAVVAIWSNTFKLFSP